jgi:hypothetical protein
MCQAGGTLVTTAGFAQELLALPDRPTPDR